MKQIFDIFSYLEVSKLLKDFIKSQPHNGRGTVKKIAEQLGVASPHVSQFLSGAKIVTVDQAYQIGRLFSWSEFEMEYWLTLVEFERANFHEAKKYFRKKLEKTRQESLNISKALGSTIELSDHDKGIFYSSWVFSAVRLFCSIGNEVTIHKIYQSFPEFKPIELIEVVEFLLQHQLIMKKGIYFDIGTQRTFVPKGSPFLKQHICNWRLRAIERTNFITDDELMYTAPMSISEAGFKKIRRDLQDYIKNISENFASYGDAEKVVCLNLDFFNVQSGENKK
jgi:uncharacterized protein (TIGR02147 family)